MLTQENKIILGNQEISGKPQNFIESTQRSVPPPLEMKILPEPIQISGKIETLSHKN